MSAESHQTTLDFWFDFDNQTLYQRTPEVQASIDASYGRLGLDLDGLVDEFRTSFASSAHPERFAERIADGAEGFRALADLQMAIIRSHFPDGTNGARQTAFEKFGEGVLYDERRIVFTDHVIHMMDGSPTTWVGYHRWHAFVRAAILSGGDAASWQEVLGWIALAWAIQSETDPMVDNPSNPGIPAGRLGELRARWLGADEGFIDAAFVHFRGPAPTEADLPSPARAGIATVAGEEQEISPYLRVQQILNDAAGTGRPNHGGKRRFWNLPHAEFMALGPVYGVQLIAPPGPDRGARSGLVLALKGEPPFGPGGFPRMPLNRPPVTPENIQFIQDWIDCDCPE
ncbi:hypothetical protein [Luteolibacter luteus]|uniref:Uncharacterized protein n=1 Tax=Luteolibacter luteus TaxID=2728835 RepID=A0A858RNC8_9BACT|nr:hypothetical protein [Luteolibacter luteus]QJE98916.1 hypothetical protein HHL09_25100 [Luteolibacter luteus]